MIDVYRNREDPFLVMDPVISYHVVNQLVAFSPIYFRDIFYVFIV